MVGAVGETASMKRRKLWKTGEDGLCCSSSAIQTRLDPSSLLEERSETPIVFVCFFCVVGYPPNWGKRPRYIDRYFIDHLFPWIFIHLFYLILTQSVAHLRKVRLILRDLSGKFSWDSSLLYAPPTESIQEPPAHAYSQHHIPQQLQNQPPQPASVSPGVIFGCFLDIFTLFGFCQ